MIIHSDENYTPAYFIDPIREFSGGFSLDPFSSREANETVKASRFLTKEQDAFAYDWHNHIIDNNVHSYQWEEEENMCVWCNPPYSRKLILPCVKKFLDYIPDHEGFLLLNSSTSSKAYHLAFNACDAILFPRKRINFVNPYKESNNSNEYEQTLFYYGTRRASFIAHMNDLCSGTRRLDSNKYYCQ